jgi:hypothetical protein
MTQADVAAEQALFPAGNIFPPGKTMAERRAAVKWNAASFYVTPTQYNAGDIGANMDDLSSAAGIVRDISVTSNSTSLKFIYRAPDARSCSVDTSVNGTWTRTADAGGVDIRSVTVNGLTPGATYNWRILCYFKQTAQFEFPPDQITSGTAATSATGLPQ